jgi:TonB family protein
VRISLTAFGRRRTVVSIAGSVAVHALVLAALVWVKAPSTEVTVKRGEPLFVELPEADERAQRGLPATPAPKPPATQAAKAAPAPTKAAPVKSAPPVVAQAPPEPQQVTPLPPPPTSAAAPAPTPPPPPVARAPVPVASPTAASPEAAGPKVAVAPPEPRESVPDIRSALRGTGPGPKGTGGSGEGRAGIEGEPIPLDSRDPRYNDYLDRVRRMIKGKWAYPCVTNEETGHCEHKSAQLVIEFGILKDGRVPFVIVRKRSDFDIYDEYAVNAIKLASPFPPVPDSLTSGRKGIPILATFSYIVESSLTNLLR